MLTVLKESRDDTVVPVEVDGKPYWKISLRKYDFKPMIVPEVRIPDRITGSTTIYRSDGTVQSCGPKTK